MSRYVVTTWAEDAAGAPLDDAEVAECATTAEVAWLWDKLAEEALEVSGQDIGTFSNKNVSIYLKRGQGAFTHSKSLVYGDAKLRACMRVEYKPKLYTSQFLDVQVRVRGNRVWVSPDGGDFIEFQEYQA